MLAHLPALPQGAKRSRGHASDNGSGQGGSHHSSSGNNNSGGLGLGLDLPLAALDMRRVDTRLANADAALSGLGGLSTSGLFTNTHGMPARTLGGAAGVDSLLAEAYPTLTLSALHSQQQQQQHGGMGGAGGLAMGGLNGGNMLLSLFSDGQLVGQGRGSQPGAAGFHPGLMQHQHQHQQVVTGGLPDAALLLNQRSHQQQQQHMQQQLGQGQAGSREEGGGPDLDVEGELHTIVQVSDRERMWVGPEIEVLHGLGAAGGENGGGGCPRRPVYLLQHARTADLPRSCGAGLCAL